VLAEEAEGLATGFELPTQSFEAQRRRLSETLAASDVGREIEVLVKGLFNPAE
jgi:hypothetical protein